jgi:hypothetical protein
VQALRHACIVRVPLIGPVKRQVTHVTSFYTHKNPFLNCV